MLQVFFVKTGIFAYLALKMAAKRAPWNTIS